MKKRKVQDDDYYLSESEYDKLGDDPDQASTDIDESSGPSNLSSSQKPKKNSGEPSGLKNLPSRPSSKTYFAENDISKDESQANKDGKGDGDTERNSRRGKGPGGTSASTKQSSRNEGGGKGQGNRDERNTNKSQTERNGDTEKGKDDDREESKEKGKGKEAETSHSKSNSKKRKRPESEEDKATREGDLSHSKPSRNDPGKSKGTTKIQGKEPQHKLGKRDSVHSGNDSGSDSENDDSESGEESEGFHNLTTDEILETNQKILGFLEDRGIQFKEQFQNLACDLLRGTVHLVHHSQVSRRATPTGHEQTAHRVSKMVFLWDPSLDAKGAGRVIKAFLKKKISNQLKGKIGTWFTGFRMTFKRATWEARKYLSRHSDVNVDDYLNKDNLYCFFSRCLEKTKFLEVPMDILSPLKAYTAAHIQFAQKYKERKEYTKNEHFTEVSGISPERIYAWMKSDD